MPIGGGASTGNEDRLKPAHISIHRQAVAELDRNLAQGATVGTSVCTLEYRADSPDVQAGVDINQQLFVAAGVAPRRLKSAMISTRERADDPKLIASIADCGLFYVPGGDQSQIVALWKGTRMQTLLQNTLKQGGGIMGKSAGAAVQGSLIFVPGEDSVTSTGAFLEKVEIKPGEFLQEFFAQVLPNFPRLYVETHTGDRERSARALVILAYADQIQTSTEPRAIAIAVDSDTAVLIHYDSSLSAWTGRVLGARAAEFLIPDRRASSRIDGQGQASYSDMPSSLLLEGLEIGLTGRYQGALVNNKSMDGPAFRSVAVVPGGRNCYGNIPGTVFGDISEDQRAASEVTFFVKDPISQQKQDLDAIEYAYLNGEMELQRETGCGYWQTNAFSRSQGNPENRLNVQRYALGVGQADFSVSLPNTMKASRRKDSKGGTCLSFAPIASDLSSSVFVMDIRNATRRLVSKYVYEEFGARAATQVGGWVSGRVHLVPPRQDICLGPQ